MNNFKTHFITAQMAYKQARPTSTTESFGYCTNHANVVEEVLKAIDAQVQAEADAKAARFLTN